MKKSTKSVILSMLVFPGAGHLYLKKYRLGLLLSIGAAAATYFIVSNAVQTALEVVGNIQVGSVPLEIGALTELLSQQSRVSKDSTYLAMIALCIFWVVGILDSLRVAYMLEKSDSVSHEN